MCKTILCNLFAGALLLFMPVSSLPQRVRLISKLHVGQTLIYEVDFRSSRQSKAESQVTSPLLNPSTELNATCLLQVEVARVTAGGFFLKTYLSEKAEPSQPANSAPAQPDAAPDKIIEVFVALDGTVSQIKGLDQLSVSQQFAWNAWLARFTSSWTYPKAGIHLGERWQVSEPETTPSPVAKLVWLRKYQYVRDEACLSGGSGADRGAKQTPSDVCAVILVQAQLRQESSPNKATPEDFKLRGLATRGTASGTNETILYISKASGLLVRSTEDAEQTMDATIALADGSNQVRYLMNAKSRSEVQLISESLQGPH